MLGVETQESAAGWRDHPKPIWEKHAPNQQFSCLMTADTIAFVDLFFRGSPGFVTVWDGATKASRHVATSDTQAVVDASFVVDAKGHDSYFGVAPRKIGRAHV